LKSNLGDLKTKRKDGKSRSLKVTMRLLNIRCVIK